jgi:Putative DNA-binding domain
MTIAQEHFATTHNGQLARVPATIRATIGGGVKSGLKLYRDNIIVALVNALAARYPVVRRMAGEESFRMAAHRFVMAEPPGSPILPRYGETFPRFLRNLGRGASCEYLADIAELEMACGRAGRAADASPIEAQALAPLATERLDRLRVRLHPSVSLVASRFPIVTIWQANRSDDGDGMIDRWRPEAALVARVSGEVAVRRLPAGGHAFLAALLEGATMAAAAKAGTADAAGFDLAANLAVLFESRIVVGIDRDV